MEQRWARPLQEILALESAGDDVFVTTLQGFGAVTLGCATLAAARTCDGRALHSLHSYFIRPVPTNQPVRLLVERLRDGRRFASRRVQIKHNDRLLFEMSASFASAGPGAEHQDAVADLSVPQPDDLPTEDEIGREENWTVDEPIPLWGPLEMRWTEIPWRVAGSSRSRFVAWVRPRSPLPRDSAMNAAAIAYLSDYHSHMSVARNLGAHFEPWGYTSLDQVIWLHRDLHWDDWRLFVTECDIASGGRALTRRTLYSRDGLLVASMAQEQLIPAANDPEPVPRDR